MDTIEMFEEWIESYIGNWSDNRQAVAMLVQAKATLILAKQMRRLADVMVENSGDSGILVDARLDQRIE